MSARVRAFLVLLWLSILLLAGCNTTTPPPPPDNADLEGLWLVTPAAGTEYGSGGTTTLLFGAAASGSATFLSQAASNDIKTCQRHVYAVLSENVVLLDGEYYVAQESANQIVLDNGVDKLTLDRVTGPAPVTACTEATLSVMETLTQDVGSFSTLNAIGSKLYFNIAEPNDAIVSYDTVTGVLGTPRVYSDSVSGGTHRWVVGARTDDLFYGHCGCGGSTSLDRFDLNLNTSLMSVETDTGLGINFGVRYGYFAGTSIVAGGRDRDQDGKNVLVTLDPDTLTLISQRNILDEAQIRDVAEVDGQLLALVDQTLVVVGATGRAVDTIKLDGLASDFPAGFTSIGSTVYLLDRGADNEVILFELTLP